MVWEHFAAETVREVRRERGLSQRALAKAAGVPQSTISEIEAGSRQPTLPLLGRIVGAAVGCTGELQLVVRDRYSAAAVAHRIAAAVADAGGPPLSAVPGSSSPAWEDTALRAVLDLRDALLRSEPAEATARTEERPALCGDRRFDALVAAVVEDACARLGIPSPTWTAECERFVRPVWHLSTVAALHWWELTTAPGAFVRHGVLAAEAELQSV